MDFTALCNSGIHNGLQPFRGGGDGFHHGTAQFGGERRYINDGLLFCIDIALVQGDHHGDAQFQQLSREEQTAAQVGGIHNVDDGIGVFVLYIGTGDALLRCERGHGVGAGQIHGDQIFRPTAVGFLNVVLLFFNRHAGPVAHLLISPGEGVVHGGFAGVRVASQGNTHDISSFSMCAMYFIHNSAVALC